MGFEEGVHELPEPAVRLLEIPSFRDVNYFCKKPSMPREACRGNRCIGTPQPIQGSFQIFRHRVERCR